MNGFIKAFGEKAVTIEISSKQQFYAPLSGISVNVLELLHFSDVFFNHLIHVCFDVDYNNYSYSTPYGKRFYAHNVVLDSSTPSFLVL